MNLAVAMSSTLIGCCRPKVQAQRAGQGPRPRSDRALAWTGATDALDLGRPRGRRGGLCRRGRCGSRAARARPDDRRPGSRARFEHRKRGGSGGGAFGVWSSASTSRPAQDFADAEVRAGWVAQRHLVAFTMHDPDNLLREVDLLATSPIPYAELAADADLLTIDGVSVPVASLAHLVAMKRHAGRPQDLADIAALSALQPGPMVDGDDHSQA